MQQDLVAAQRCDAQVEEDPVENGHRNGAHKRPIVSIVGIVGVVGIVGTVGTVGTDGAVGIVGIVGIGAGVEDMQYVAHSQLCY